MKKVLVFASVFVVMMSLLVPAQTQSRVTVIQGKVSILRKDAPDWVNARPNMPLAEGDQLYTREESFAEIIYANGVIVRLDELTKITVTAASDKSAKVKTGTGEVWVNMRKLVSSGGKEFELSTPTATAAIRGTVFHAATHKDSSTDVAVFEGTVAVGPGDELQKSQQSVPQPATEPVEISGPEEIPGPYEVSLDEWKNIVAGQRISVRRDGKFAQERFSATKAAKSSSFVKRNLELDRDN
jgi:ferric-dicitrate binding protein FerR (iron transport regulator)